MLNLELSYKLIYPLAVVVRQSLNKLVAVLRDESLQLIHRTENLSHSFLKVTNLRMLFTERLIGGNLNLDCLSAIDFRAFFRFSALTPQSRASSEALRRQQEWRPINSRRSRSFGGFIDFGLVVLHPRRRRLLLISSVSVSVIQGRIIHELFLLSLAPSGEELSDSPPLPPPLPLARD